MPGLDPRDEQGPRTVEREASHAAERDARRLSGHEERRIRNAIRYAGFSDIIKRLPEELKSALTLDEAHDFVCIYVNRGGPVPLFTRAEIEDNVHKFEVLDRRLRALGIEPVGEPEIPTTEHNRDWIEHCPVRLGPQTFDVD